MPKIRRKNTGVVTTKGEKAPSAEQRDKRLAAAKKRTGKPGEGWRWNGKAWYKPGSSSKTTKPVGDAGKIRKKISILQGKKKAAKSKMERGVLDNNIRLLQQRLKRVLKG